MNTNEFKSELLEQAVNMAKENGLKVFAFQKNEKIGQVFITDGIKIGTISADYFYGLNFDTVHKPCKEFGRGFRLNGSAKTDFNIQDIEKCMNTVKPVGFSQHKGEVKKHASWDEYLSKNTNLNYYEI